MDSRQAPDFLVPASRRRALTLIATGAAALTAGVSPASAFSFFRRGSSASARIDLNGLSSEWVARQGSDLKAYADFLAGLKLQRLTPRQVIEAHAKRRGSVWNSLPPKKMWRNIAPTLKVIDRVAMELGQPVEEIVSVYRSPAYNARCAGASRGSWHKANVAVDVAFPIRASVVASTARSLRSRGLFKGGVGRYSSFTHIDTRGQNVDW